MYNNREPIQDIVNKIFINNTNILDPSFILINSKKVLELNLNELLTKFTNGVDINTVTFKTFYNKYKNDYINLTPELFKLYIEHTLYSSVPFLFKNLEPSLNDFYNQSKNLRIQLKKYYAEKIVIGSQVKKQLINYKHNKPVYNILNCNVNFNINTSTSSYINLTKLIKEYPLSETVPYMNYNSIIKTYTGFNFNNEKNYNDKIVLKLRYLNTTSKSSKSTKSSSINKDNYALCYIYDNGNVTIKYNFKKTDNINFDNVFEYTKSIFATSKIMKFLNLNKNYQVNIKYTIISFEINKNSKYSNIQSNINNEPFQIQPKLKKDILTLKFKSHDDGGQGHSIIINNKFVNTKVTAYGFVFESELLNAIDSLLNVFYRTESRKLNVKINLIKHRKLGIDTLSCQKIRQPTLINRGDSNNDIAPYQVKTYPLKDPKTNHTFTCDNKNFPYPGFTNVNSICCFKKDQRNKYIFKKNIGAIVNNDDILHFLNDDELLHNPIIKTNKALEPNRIGVLQKLNKFLLDIKLGSNFYRIGNTCGLLGAVQLLLKKKIDLNKITLTEKVFMSLDNGNIANKYKLHDYLNLIKNKLITDGLLELLAYHTQLNFIYISQHLILHKFNKSSQEAYIISNCNEPIINIKSNKIIRTFNISQFILQKNDLQLLAEKVKINKQFVVNNKVTYISSNYGILPINSECGILLDYPFTEKFNLPLLDLQKQYKYLLQLKYNVIGQFTSNFGSFGSSKIDGLIVSYGNDNNILIPTKSSNELINGMKLFYLQFVPLGPSVTKSSKSNVIKYGLELDIYNEIYQRICYLLNVIQLKFNILNKELTEKEIINILKNYITFADVQINSIVDLPNVKTICSPLLSNVSNVSNDPFCDNDEGKLKIPKKYFKGIIKKIVMDINTQNPRGKQIISGKINKEYFNKDNFIKRSVEKIIIQ